jgi:hypothetical protein
MAQDTLRREVLSLLAAESGDGNADPGELGPDRLGGFLEDGEGVGAY